MNIAPATRDRSKENELVFAVLSYASRCVAEGDIHALRGLGFQLDDIGVIERLSLAELQLPINVVGVIAASENLPDGAANKPGDVVTSMAGITIEILNTDAEGRLILCDALTYTEQTYDPAVCIDMATLTGAIVVALGGYPTGLFANAPGLSRSLTQAGEQIGDRVWEMPLWPEYEDHIRSECADIANIATVGGRDGGAIIGASFLHKFTKKMKWAHLDIAGTAWKGKRSTGRPVPLIVQYLLNAAAKHHD